MSDRTMTVYGGTSGPSMGGTRGVVTLTTGTGGMGGNSTPQAVSISPPLNQPKLDFRAGKVRIEALVDHEGLAELQSSLAALHSLMGPKTPQDMASDLERSARRPDPFAWR